MTLPANIVNKDATITTDIVDCVLPLLLSKAAMKKAEVKLDFVNDKVDILGSNVDLLFTSSGHYIIPLNVPKKEDINMAEIWQLVTFLKCYLMKKH